MFARLIVGLGLVALGFVIGKEMGRAQDAYDRLRECDDPDGNDRTAAQQEHQRTTS